MKKVTLGIILNGVTGRMGYNQHLKRSLIPLIEEGGLVVSKHLTIIPEVLLMGRNADKLAQISIETGFPWTTNLDEALNDSKYSIYFDAQITSRRSQDVRKAIAAGKHVYCEKPIAADSKEAFALFELAEKSGCCHGVVQDKLWLPGIRKLMNLIDTGFFGEVLSAKGDFGYWVFDGKTRPAQRPSWNYRKEMGGGIMLDMLCHWHYLIERLLGPVSAVMCNGTTQIKRRIDEQHKEYECTADDAAYLMAETKSNVAVRFDASWCTRVRRDDLLTIQIDGTEGSAVAGLRDCWTQSADETPRPVWNPDLPQNIDFYANWNRVPHAYSYQNAFKAQWELFLRHVALNEPFTWDLLAGARGVLFAETGMLSSARREWVDFPNVKTRIT